MQQDFLSSYKVSPISKDAQWSPDVDPPDPINDSCSLTGKYISETEYFPYRFNTNIGNPVLRI